jgi:hypothetical protein
MYRTALLASTLLVAPCTTRAQQPTVPHDSVRGAIRAVDARARTVEVTTGVGYALRVVRLQVPAGVPITDRQNAQPALIALADLKLGDVVQARFGGQAAPFVAYTIDRLGRMATGVERTP